MCLGSQIAQHHDSKVDTITEQKTPKASQKRFKHNSGEIKRNRRARFAAEINEGPPLFSCHTKSMVNSASSSQP